MGCSTSQQPDDFSSNRGNSPNIRRLSRFQRLSNTLSFSIKSKADATSGPEFIRNSLLTNPIFNLLLQAWSTDDINVLVKSFTKFEVEGGETIMDIGDQSKDVLILSSGNVSIVGSDGQYLRMCKPGDVLGEIGFLNGAPRDERYIASIRCVLYRLNVNTFESITESLDFMFKKHPLLRVVQVDYREKLFASVNVVKFKSKSARQILVDSRISHPWITDQFLCCVLKGKITGNDVTINEDQYCRGDLLITDPYAVAPNTILLLFNESDLYSPAMKPVLRQLEKDDLDFNVKSGGDRYMSFRRVTKNSFEPGDYEMFDLGLGLGKSPDSFFSTSKTDSGSSADNDALGTGTGEEDETDLGACGTWDVATCRVFSS